jgi:threonine dehydrogenase-like Zn-dependent dehydrogenase
MAGLPETQYAVQLVGPDKLLLNTAKPLAAPGPHQFLCRVEAVGLCFSDLKLLKQFSSHVRKGPVTGGIGRRVLDQIPSYVPGTAATVPGHEAVVRVAAAGPAVKGFAAGRRYLVQTDYRWLPTAGSNAAFGYNFEGALQEYTLMDERVITSPGGESMLLDVSEGLSAAAAALVEPWACVENAYRSRQRRSVRPGGRMAVVADAPVEAGLFSAFFERFRRPAAVTWVSPSRPPRLGITFTRADSVAALDDGGFDDAVYLGSAADTIEVLFAKLRQGGILNIALCGGAVGRKVRVPVGRVHYGGLRVTGTVSCDPAASMESIPQSGQIRRGDTVAVTGAAGPMGMMHVVRSICLGPDALPSAVYAVDVDDRRLSILEQVAGPMAEGRGVFYRGVNRGGEALRQPVDYAVVCAPEPALVSEAVEAARAGGIVNIFAGIPDTVDAELDLDGYIRKGLYLVGTSGSLLEDMKAVLARVESGMLNTNVSVAAVCGLAGAIDGIRAVEKRLVAGKIVVYPACRKLGLVRLGDMAARIPQVASHLADGPAGWTKAAEERLLQLYGQSHS